ncbi:DUF3099 domain-containing protein [Allonocardiopsis opalescens]|uniref:DUF3099 family protein n=1 Tax=Allonocardiopsis opalescens TaxID=1144618 RepID=A0A2T0Q477_9ACTN|nr:DUF3099 domain-containing protein [Allonocardiopsis opalescens]PRX98618.1 Protein of unknown function (DUF3099) [Allonocardiopsis opalescens]
MVSFRHPFARSREAAQTVTDALPPRSEDIDRRQRHYIVMMSVRLGCFLAALACYRWPWLAAGLIVGAVFLPYVAVSAANAGRTDRPGSPRFVDRPARRALPGGRDADGHNEIS